jgi:hypothetical protein
MYRLPLDYTHKWMLRTNSQPQRNQKGFRGFIITPTFFPLSRGHTLKVVKAEKGKSLDIKSSDIALTYDWIWDGMVRFILLYDVSSLNSRGPRV